MNVLLRAPGPVPQSDSNNVPTVQHRQGTQAFENSSVQVEEGLGDLAGMAAQYANEQNDTQLNLRPHVTPLNLGASPHLPAK
jgi:hypothetical protein